MNLVVDIGNSATKLGLFKNKDLLATHSAKKITRKDILDFFNQAPEKVSNVILSSVKDIPTDLEDFFTNCFKNYLKLDQGLNLPFNSNYKTPKTLGADRIAVVTAAAELYPNTNCLIIDMGSCITFDIIDENLTYHGGAISPGLNMRFKAMHNFTGRLPFIKSTNALGETNLIGNSTKNSMKSGVFQGILAELNGAIDAYHSNFDNLQVLLTGGDSTLFEKLLKKRIFAHPNLVLVGLNKILTFNLEE